MERACTPSAITPIPRAAVVPSGPTVISAHAGRDRATRAVSSSNSAVAATVSGSSSSARATGTLTDRRSDCRRDDRSGRWRKRSAAELRPREAPGPSKGCSDLDVEQPNPS